MQLQCSGCLARDMVKACRQCWRCQQLAWLMRIKAGRRLASQAIWHAPMRTCPDLGVDQPLLLAERSPESQHKRRCQLADVQPNLRTARSIHAG